MLLQCRGKRERERDDWSWLGSLGWFARERESKREEKKKIVVLAEI
jgi:hypothetical protein